MRHFGNATTAVGTCKMGKYWNMTRKAYEYDVFSPTNGKVYARRLNYNDANDAVVRLRKKDPSVMMALH
jgi:hypothetical protein